ncbi:hypothetical protein CAPTEDRAFT_198463 [Capitella teleta]|uniref:Uncharacterized protein n=1 Tax=Capitella teleta TaxID=283909 RepID=R7TM36_CAPTE|nr:hypothetical protein CAPTEDRAFT_198463 [Capitella teleta]|eukprot:ELT94714.1 hypothetical protein CAPTEDRAFT_198463 [Capitella teleta]
MGNFMHVVEEVKNKKMAVKMRCKLCCKHTQKIQGDHRIKKAIVKEVEMKVRKKNAAQKCKERQAKLKDNDLIETEVDVNIKIEQQRERKCEYIRKRRAQQSVDEAIDARLKDSKTKRLKRSGE